jgi:hydroxymethylbilane synthase
VRTLRIGTRRSALARAQAEAVRAALDAEQVDAVIVPLSTAGDEGQAPEGPAGAKGLWTGAIAQALRQGEIDLAVHSAKDLPSEDDEGLTIGAVPERADPRDVLVVREDREWLRPGIRVGTSSLRRRAQVLAAQPEAVVLPLRGNVDTRLRKVGDGEVDAAILAAAGLERLGIASSHATPLGVDVMLPAPGQGALAVQCRAEARDLLAVLELLDHRASRIAFETERALVRSLGGDCALPLGALAVARGDTIRLAARVCSPDGDEVLDAAAQAADPARAVRMVVRQLRDAGADDVLERARSAT